MKTKVERRGHIVQERRVDNMKVDGTHILKYALQKRFATSEKREENIEKNVTRKSRWVSESNVILSSILFLIESHRCMPVQLCLVGLPFWVQPTLM